MHVRAGVGVLSLIFSLAGPVGCKKREAQAEVEANAKRVTADSTIDATQPIVDEEYRFRLDHPGDGWKLLHERDIRKIVPDAIAGGANGEAKTFGAIIVERAPGVPLEQAAELIFSAAQSPSSTVESLNDLEFSGTKAKRSQFVTEVEGTEFRYLNTVFVHSDHIYQVLSWTPVELASSASGAALVEFHDSFHLLEGPVVGRRPETETVTEADGLGWRIRGGRYESALSGLSIEPPRTWRFIVGPELDHFNADAELALSRDESNAYLTVITERVPSKHVRETIELTRQMLESELGPTVGPSLVRELGGREVEFRRHAQPPLTYLHGVYAAEDVISQIALWYPWYPATLEDSMAPSIDEVLAAFSAASRAERDELRKELIETSPNQRRMSKHRSYRAKTFLDFEHQLRWTEPPGFWKVSSFDAALENSAETVLYLEELELGLQVALEVLEDEIDPRTLLDELVADEEVLHRETQDIAGVLHHRARTRSEVMGATFIYTHDVARHGSRTVVFSLWGQADTPRHRAAATTAMDALEFVEGLQPTETAAGQFTDHLFGVTFGGLPSGYRSQVSRELPAGRVESWKRGRSEVTYLVLPGPATEDEDWVFDFMEQVLRDEMGKRASLGTPTRSEGTLGRHASRRLTWSSMLQTVEADLVVRDGIVYAMMFANAPDDVTGPIRSSFELLE